MSDKPSSDVTSVTAASGRDQALNAILADYFLTAEAGNAPSREDLLARHPDFHAEIEAFLDQFDEMHNLAAPVRDASSPTLLAANRANQTPTPTHVAGREPGRAVEPLTTEQTFGDYVLMEELGRGGMGVIYKARQVSVPRIVALKMILQGSLARSDDVMRFRAEAEAAAQLDHPNIVPIYDVGERGGSYYFTMKLIDGGSLADHKEAFMRDQRAAARLVATIARAVHYAHQRGILHRDLKPGNVLLSGQRLVASGQQERNPTAASPGKDRLTTNHWPLTTGDVVPYVTDFGLAKRMDVDSNLTQSGAIVGTPNYMSPEQAAGRKDLTTATDVYALGTILYELLAGRKPFQADTPMATLLRVQQEEPDRIRSIVPQVDADVETICLKAMQKDPNCRYGSAEALATDLEHWLAGEPIQARATTWSETLLRWIKKRPAVAALLAVVFITNAIGLLLITLQWRAAEQARTEAVLAKGEADKNAEEARSALTKAEKNLYFSSLASAQNEWTNNNVERAKRFLEDCPSKLRGWEWHFLARQYQGSLHTFAQTKGPIRFNADGTLFATRSGDKVRVWDTRSGKVTATLGDRSASPIAVAFRDDNRVVIHDGKSLRVWTLDGKLDKEHAVPRSLCALSEDGMRLAAFQKGDLVLWDTQTCAEIKTLKIDEASAIVFSPDGRLLAVSNAKGIVVWDVAKGERLHELPLDHIVTFLSFSADSSMLASTHLIQRHVTIWEMAKGTVLRKTTLESAPSGATFISGGKRLAIGGMDGALHVLDIASGLIVGAFKGHARFVATVVVSRDGSMLAADSVTGETRIWELDVERGRNFRMGEAAGQLFDFSGDGRWLARLGWDNDVLLTNFLDRATKAIKVDVPISHVLFTRSAKRPLLALLGPRHLLLVDPAQRQVVTRKEVTAPKSLRAVGEDLLVSGAGEIAFYSVPDLQEKRRIKADCQVVYPILGNDDLLLAKGTKHVIVDGTTGAERFTLAEGYDRIAAVSADLRLAAFFKGHHQIDVWDVREREIVAQIRSGRILHSVAISPDNRRMVWGQDDGTIKIGDLESSREILTLKIQTDFLIPAVTAVQFSPDGRRIAGQVVRQLTLWETDEEK